jgi:carbamoyltransferase
MEYGPRALGSRSILASAKDKHINDSLNKRLNRTEFMPFAPATIDELAPLCFENWDSQNNCARFMTTCYECTSFMIENCPATVHIDNTARPQVVRFNDNPDYYNLIRRYYKVSGRPALINTSFNHHEEPIVCTPEDAIRSFKKGNVDILFIENIMITNQ